VKGSEMFKVGDKFDAGCGLGIHRVVSGAYLEDRGYDKTIRLTNVLSDDVFFEIYVTPNELYEDWLLSKMTGNQEQNKPTTTEQFDEVTKPKHYMLLPDKDVEVRDVVRAVVNRMSTNGYSAMQCSDYAQALQYILRFDEKGGTKDLEKAKWYLDKIIKAQTMKGN
jgi:hypothetical protein